MPEKFRSSLGSVVADGPSRWRVRVSMGRDPATGKRVQVEHVVRGSRRDADAELGRMLVRAGKASGIVSRMTLSEYLDSMYLPRCRERLRENTVAGYESTICAHIYPTIGARQLSSLDRADVERCLSSVGSPGARLKVYKTLRQALRQALRWGMVDRVATDAVEVPKVPRSKTEVLSPEQAARVVEAFHGHAVEPGILMALGCGLRRSEVCALDWEDVDGRARTVEVTKSFHVVAGERLMREPKTSNSWRTVSVPSTFALRLEELRRPGGGPLMLDSDGERMAPDTFSRLYVEHAKEEGVYWVPLKNLRHSHATIMLSSGVDVVAVSRRLGHSSVSVTDAFYLRPTRAADERAADAFDRCWDGSNRPSLPL